MEERKKLLIVDDVNGIRREYVELLSPYFHMAEASSGGEALLLFKTFEPHGVLLDLHLEGTSDDLQGEELLKLMKRLNPEVYICLVSGDDSQKEKLLQAGADQFILKPPSRGELFDFFISVGLLSPVLEHLI